MEGPHLHALVHTALAQHRLDAPGQRAVVAKDEDGLARLRRRRQLLRAVDQDHGLARARRPVDDPVAGPQRACNLLLLQVHHLKQIGQIPRRRLGLTDRQQ